MTPARRRKVYTERERGRERERERGRERESGRRAIGMEGLDIIHELAGRKRERKSLINHA